MLPKIMRHTVKGDVIGFNLKLNDFMLVCSNLPDLLGIKKCIQCNTRFKKCKQLFEYKHLLLLDWWSKF